jgi:CRP-like cAMP-binding protein
LIDFSNYFRNPKTVVELAAGETLFAQGDDGDAMFALLSGELDVIVGDKVVDHIGPGRLIGEMALVEHAPRSATAIARTDCRLAKVDRRQFLFMVHEAPTFALDVMRELAERLHHWHASVQPD